MKSKHMNPNGSTANKPIGILGGMGPLASAAFLSTMCSMVDATKDAHHPHIIMDSNPWIPSRTRHLLYGETSPVDGMIDACLSLAAYPVDFIVVPCNSACHFLPQVAPLVPVPIMDIRDAACDTILEQVPAGSRVVVLGAFITWTERTYAEFLKARGLLLVDTDERLQTDVEACIAAIKLHGRRSDTLDMTYCLLERVSGISEAIILGCTEFGCLNLTSHDKVMVDSAEALARAALLRAGIPVKR